jgi:hypothetical protein
MAPVLRDTTWRKLAEKHETLCFSCVLERATKHQVDLNLTDLRPCPFNLKGWPSSYFNLFCEDEEHIDRTVRDQWQATALKARHWNIFPADIWSEI